MGDTSRTRRRPTLPRHSWTGCPSIRAGSTTRSTILQFRTGSQRILTRSRTSRTSTPSPSTPSTTRSTPPSTPSTASQSTVHQQQNTVHLQQNTVHLQQNTVHLQQSTVLHRQSTVLQRRSTAHLRRRSTVDTGEDDDLCHLRDAFVLGLVIMVDESVIF